MKKWNVTIFESDGKIFATRNFRTMDEADAFAVGFHVAATMGGLKMQAVVKENEDKK